MKTRNLAFPGTSDSRISRWLSMAVLLTLALRGSAALAQTAGSANPSAVSEPTLAPDDSGYSQIAQPFFKKFCIGCHGPDLQEGEFRVDENLPNDFLNLTTKSHWGEVVNVLNSHEMPPEDEKQPTSREVSKVVDWITEQMVRAELVRRDTTIVLRRLNRAEYRNTISSESTSTPPASLRIHRPAASTTTAAH
jgi:mono/diheme cytochrome c family protein